MIGLLIDPVVFVLSDRTGRLLYNGILTTMVLFLIVVALATLVPIITDYRNDERQIHPILRTIDNVVYALAIIFGGVIFVFVLSILIGVPIYLAFELIWNTLHEVLV